MMRSRFLGLGKKGKNSFDMNFSRQISTFFVVFSFISGLQCLKAVDEEFSKQNKIQSQLAATDLKKKNKILTDQLEELRLQQASVGAFNISVSDITKTLVEPVIDALEDEGALHSPVKTTNQTFNAEITPKKTNLRHAIQTIVIDINTAGMAPAAVVQNVQAEFLRKLFFIFEQYIERKRNSVTRDKENLSLVARNSSSSVTIDVDEKSLLRAFELAATGVLHPNLAQLLIDCQLQVVLPTIHQPAPQMLDLKKEGARYVQKIKKAIQNEGDLYDLVQQYRPDYAPEDDAMPNRLDKHAMLIMMLGLNIESVATGFKPSTGASTMIEMGEELRDNFYDEALLTFIHYISGNTNKRQVREIIALTNGGRGQSISEHSLCLLNQELTQIFYPRRESGSLTVTRYEFGRPSRNVSGTPALNTILATSMDVLGFVFGNCLAPARQNLLTDGGNHSARSSSTPAIKDSKEEI